MKRSSHRKCNSLTTWLLLVGVCAALSCSEDVNPPKNSTGGELPQGVKGLVTITAGYDSELIDSQTLPPEPHPLAEVTVYLIDRGGADGVPVFLDSTCTDSAGQYLLACLPGKYYVAVASENIMAPILNGLPGDTTLLTRRIHAIAGLNVLEGHFFDQPLNVVELSVQ